MADYDSLHYPYTSQRMETIGLKGMVATSQPLAAQAGLDILKRGGNAIDAAIAAAACLTVVEPTSNGIGGDAFAIIWTKGELYGLNASGQSPASISIDKVKAMGYEKMPKFGLVPVTVPGAPGAWAELSRRFGKLPLPEVLEPAIDYAENGYPVSPVLAKYWRRAAAAFKQALKGREFESWFETFLPEGKAPAPGDIWKSPAHAETLREIAETRAESLYSGKLADQIDAFSREHGGFIRKEDLQAFKPQWVNPVSVNYRGYDVWEIPPNGQGMIALMALNILKKFDFAEKECADTYHKQIEAMKLAFSDGKKYITQEDRMTVSVEQLLSGGYADERSRLIGSTALDPVPGTPPSGGTVYLSSADSEGNMVSFIQSNYMGFGSGIVIPGTGLSLQNRGADFSLEKDHANSLEPSKQTYHTIIPGFLTKGGEPIGPFGVMGGYMQPQGHVQVIMNTVDFHLNPQAALDAPRWQWLEGRTVQVERSVPQHIVDSLIRKGHIIKTAADSGSFGRGQIIWRNPETGVLHGGTEPRTDGAVAVW
ncbi:gamma-glutamyltransferase family protein [Peribacillus sp. SCS-37]|uniref:gamma-glutamyltransferase family protein n=1 Tax=Paraperibacillus esterisolvens TaxID=3115296 RepID=UPI003906BD89